MLSFAHEREPDPKRAEGKTMSQQPAILEYITTDSVAPLLQQLVQTRSYNPPGDESAVGARITDWLGRAGIEVTRQVVTGGRANIIARLKGDGSQPALLLCAHQDTVPPGEAAWSRDPLGGEIVEGTLYGRGALDTKAALAGMMVALQTITQAEVPLRGDLVFLATVDEEANGLGAQAYLLSGGMQGIGAAVIGEPTSLDLIIAHRGLLWLEITTYGKPAHGSMPDRGVNAILPMNAILTKLARHSFPHTPHPLLAPPTVNIATIQGGVKINMVPDLCRATIDIRTIPGMSHAAILAETRAIASEVAESWPGLTIKVESLNDKPPLVTAADNPFVLTAVEVSASLLGRAPKLRGAPYLTDGSLLAGTTRTPAIICGPGPETMAHQIDEHIAIDEVVAVTKFYTALALQYLQS
ncbi:MAG: M20 family peptidase [Chloroflexi bacterium]|nr:M20 family peptidase [Chloroflexota bacterium]